MVLSTLLWKGHKADTHGHVFVLVWLGMKVTEGSPQKIPQALSNEVIHTVAFQLLSNFPWTSPSQVPYLLFLIVA